MLANFFDKGNQTPASHARLNIQDFVTGIDTAIPRGDLNDFLPFYHTSPSLSNHKQ